VWDSVFSALLTPEDAQPTAVIVQQDIAQTYCTDPETSECCQESATTIEENNFLLAEGAECPDDHTLGQLRCIGSLRWCEPQ